jgi:hypothetical protein
VSDEQAEPLDLDAIEAWWRAPDHIPVWHDLPATKSALALVAEVRRLRARTHEIQEVADKRYSEYVQGVKGWRDLIARADELTKEPGVHAQSAYMRATVAHLLSQRDEALAEQARLARDLAAASAALEQIHGVILDFARDHRGDQAALGQEKSQ